MLSKIWIALFWLTSAVIAAAGIFAVWLIYTLWKA